MGHQLSASMPKAPAKQILFPVTVAVLLPLMTVFVWGLVFDYARAGRVSEVESQAILLSIEAIRNTLLFNLSVGLGFALSLVFSRDVGRRLEALLVESTARDPSALLRFREGAVLSLIHISEPTRPY